MFIENYLHTRDKLNSKKSYSIAFCILCIFLLYVTQINMVSAGTGINQQIPYSGSLVNNAGVVLPDNNYRAKFVLWDALSGGTQVYQEFYDGINSNPGTGLSVPLPISDGRFDILLGSRNTTFPTITNNDTLYLEVQLDADNNALTGVGGYEEVFAPRRRIGSTVSAINALRLVAPPGGADADTLSLDIAGNVIASSLGGVANGAAGLGFDRVLLANSIGQFSQVNISTLGGWGLLGNATTDAWNGTTGTYLGTTSAQPLVLATTNATAQDIRLFTGVNGANERLRVSSTGEIIIGNGNTNAAPAAANLSGTNASGTNIAGNTFTITGGRGTGTGAGGDLLFATAPAGLTGASLNAAVTRLQITSAGNIIAPILGGAANGVAPGGFDRVLLANSSGQFSQVNISTLGGGGSPGGSNNQLQFKNGAAFAGATNVEIAQGALRLLPQSTPTAPASGVLLYSETLAGRDVPYYMTSSGRKDAVGPAFFGKQVPFQVGVANGTTAPPTIGGSVVTAATLSYQFSAISTNRYTSMPRKRYNTASANATTGIRQDYGMFYSGNAAGYGGVFFSARFGVNANKLSTVFVGLTSSTAALGGNASALTNMIGMGYDLTDPITGNWFLMKNNGAGTAQRIDLLATNAARAGDIGFELNMYNPPNSTTWFVYITNLNTGAVVLNTSYVADAEVPVVNTGLAMKAEIRNDAVATNANIEHHYIYVEPQGL
jgi:hypothetical protein